MSGEAQHAADTQHSEDHDDEEDGQEVLVEGDFVYYHDVLNPHGQHAQDVYDVHHRLPEAYTIWADEQAHEELDREERGEERVDVLERRVRDSLYHQYDLTVRRGRRRLIRLSGNHVVERVLGTVETHRYDFGV